MTVSLPDYLTALSTSDPAYAALNETVNRFLLKGPGEGAFKEAEIITFTKSHHVYRVYGGEGKAGQCGFWWNLDAPQDTTKSYFEEFAVCEEWNDATHMVRCNVPEGYNAVVGIGQSAACANNETIVPDDSVLQLNGAICDIADQEGPGLTCEWCAADDEALQDSACVARLLGSGATSTSGFHAGVFASIVIGLMGSLLN